MGLRIATNITALNAQRQLSATRMHLDRSLERLASGSRINHAGDDAAGLQECEVNSLTAITGGGTSKVLNVNTLTVSGAGTVRPARGLSAAGGRRPGDRQQRSDPGLAAAPGRGPELPEASGRYRRAARGGPVPS